MFRPGSVGSKPVRPLDVLLGYEPGSFPVQVVGNISSEHCGGVPLVLPLPGGAKTGYHGLDRIPKEVPGTFFGIYRYLKSICLSDTRNIKHLV